MQLIQRNIYNELTSIQQLFKLIFEDEYSDEAQIFLQKINDRTLDVRFAAGQSFLAGLLQSFIVGKFKDYSVP